MKLSDGQIIETTAGKTYTVTCSVDVSVYEMDGSLQGLKLLDYKATDGQKEFRATSMQVKVVTGSASDVQGSVTEVFKGAPALVTQGGGLDLIPQDGGVYGVTYINGQYQGVAVDRKPLIDKTVYDDISLMTQVLPPGTYDFEMSLLAHSSTTGGRMWEEWLKQSGMDSITSARFSNPTLLTYVELISSTGDEYFMDSFDPKGTGVRTPLKIDNDGIYVSHTSTSDLSLTMYMSKSILRLTIKPTSTATFAQLVQDMFATAISDGWMKAKCIPHVIKVYPV